MPTVDIPHYQDGDFLVDYEEKVFAIEPDRIVLRNERGELINYFKKAYESKNQVWVNELL